VKSASRSSEATATVSDGIVEEQDADSGAPADAVDEPDPERAERCPHRVTVLALGMRMGVEVEVAVSPADEQAEREEHDQGGYRGLRTLLDALGNEALGEEDRSAEEDERDAVADAPPCAEACRGARGLLASGGDERRHGGDVVRIRGMP
jgi:hypothetical protein